MKVEQIQVTTHRRNELLDITRLIQEYIDRINLDDGVIILWVPHTTAALTINENADPDVVRDILFKMEREYPQQDNYHHGEGNSDAHIKSSLFGPSLNLIVDSGKLLLGTWQAVYFCEFDGPRKRKLYLKALSG